MEQEAAESCCLKLSLIPIFSGTLIPSLHLHTCLILSHSFIHSFPPLPESAPKASRQAGYWIQTPKLLPGLISSRVFVERLFLKKPFKENKMPTPGCVLERAEMIPEANPSYDPEFCPAFTQELHHLTHGHPRGIIFIFPKQRRQSKETLQAKFLHTKCPSPKGVMKA